MNNPSTASSSSHLERIDVLRAVAILLVYLCHALPSATGRNAYELLGWAGVALFFVVSGFCIHLSFLKQREKTPAASLASFTWQFWWRRFWRIYPPYLVALIVFWFLHQRHSDLPTWHFWTHLLLVNNFWEESFGSVAAPFWSLAVEWQFYLLYPAFLWLLQRVGLRSALVFVAVLSVVLRGGGVLAQDWHAPLVQTFWYSPLILFFDWSLGILLAELWSKRKAARILELFALPALLLFVLSHRTPLTSAFSFTLAAIAFAGIMSFYLRQSGKLNFWERLLVPLGVCSYSFYLWHHPLIGRSIHWFHKLGIPDGKFADALLVGIALPMCFILWSWLSYCCIEKPSIAVGQRLWGKYFKPVALPISKTGK